MASKETIGVDDGVHAAADAVVGTPVVSTAERPPSAAVMEASSTSSTSRGKSDNDKTKKGLMIGDQMDHVLQLLSQRVNGQATNEEVESAVNTILTAMGTSKPPAEAKTTTTALDSSTCPGPTIREDTGNYDSDEDDNNDDEMQDKKPSASVTASHGSTKRKHPFDSKDDIDLSTAEEKEDVSKGGNPFNQADYDDAISQIPMGWEAAKMMTTFGDGPKPQPDALESALTGTRQSLQMAIMDARIIRRRLQKDFQKAEATVDPNAFKRQNDKKTKAKKKARQQQEGNTSTKLGSSIAATTGDEATTKNRLQLSQSSHQVEAVDPMMVYRALAGGTDKLSQDQKCGFHMEELTQLFPEEMRAYQRWTEMHEEYNEKKGEKDQLKEKALAVGQDGDEEDDGEKEDDPPPSPKITPIQDVDGGHLQERAAHFDFRTDRMKKDWYMEYAKVRQGSFLPSAMRVRRTQAEKDWDELRKKKKGRQFEGSWECMSGRSVRFLHWLGFDPPNLYPPDEEVTHALAFLAYDRLGRIVEKAIYLRNLAVGRVNKGDEEGEMPNGITGFLWELQEGEQLSKKDIERALEDPDVKPATLFGMDESGLTQTSVQLYFGPGWEDRLELEMEEFLVATGGGDQGPRLTNEERALREQEAALLVKISGPPAIGEESLKRLVAEKKTEG